MAKKKYYMVIDTETCGDYVFDIGYRVIDRKGNCYASGSYVVKEFIDSPSVLDMFEDKFTRNKIGKYYYDLWKHYDNFIVEEFNQIHFIVNNLIKQYDATICAYNIVFDLQHLEKTAEYFGKNTFFDYDIETIDIWHMAMSILGTKKYIRFCMKHNLLTAANNISTGAETMYRYITNNPTFKEEHTAHEDCIIECAIMVKCFRRKKHFETSIVGMCIHNKEWNRIQNNYKEMF